MTGSVRPASQPEFAAYEAFDAVVDFAADHTFFDAKGHGGLMKQFPEPAGQLAVIKLAWVQRGVAIPRQDFPW